MRKLIGIKFKDGGRNPDEGFDCWGLVCWYYREELGVELPDYMIGAYNSVSISEKIGHAKGLGWHRLVDRTQLCRHNLITFNLDCDGNPSLTTHIGIWMQDGDRFLHAMNKTGVIQSRLGDSFWRLRTSGYFQWTGLLP